MKVYKNIIRRSFLMVMMFMMGTVAVFADVHSLEYYDTNVRNHFKNQRWQQGKRLLDEGYELYSGNSVMNELQGWYYYHYKKYDQARYYIVKSLREEPSNIHSRELIINVEEESKNYSSAICYINEMLEYNPYNRGWWRRKIALYRKIGNNVEADRLLQRLRQIYPDDPQVKKDMSYQSELDYYNSKKVGNTEGQLKALRELVTLHPKNAAAYMDLANLYLQLGRNGEAAEVAGEGVKNTGSVELVRKRVAILMEMGNFTEANNYLTGYMRTNRSNALADLQRNLQMEMAYAALQNDPYTMFGKVYETQHSDEALTYLINTAMSRGYYDDALGYLSDAKKKKGETEEIMYKLYIVNSRLGNKNTANSLLTRFVEKFPKNTDAIEELATLRFEQASSLMLAGQYAEAIPYLEYTSSNSTDSATINDATSRLYNCYIETKNYERAIEMLQVLSPKISKVRYALMQSNLQVMRHRQPEALRILKEAYDEAATDADRYLLASAYEEVAVPYVKALMERGMVRQANTYAVEAVQISPRSIDLLNQAISTSYRLGNKEEYMSLVARARLSYPDDPAFIVKEAGIFTMEKNYKSAIESLRRYLDIYIGDSSIINAFSENSELYALQCLKQKHPYEAMVVVDSALLYNRTSNTLLYTKGRIFEDLHEYDSAYVYQLYYKPTLMDFKEHKHHLEEILYRGAKNEIYLEYMYYRPGAEDKITGTAFASYTRKLKKNSYTFSLGYAGRDGSVAKDLAVDEQIPGGVGVQPGFTWSHIFNSRWSGDVSIAWANRYMPKWTLKASLTRNMKNDWTLGGRVSWRLLDSYSALYNVVHNPAAAGTTDPEYVSLFAGWNHSRKSMFNLGATLSKTMGIFAFSGSADLMYLNKNVYVSGSLKGQLFPIDGNHSHVFASGGLGTAPELSLIDRSMPTSFNRINTFVSWGGLYVVNRHLSMGITGDWYTSFNNKEKAGTEYLSESSIYQTTVSVSTSYRNLFFVHGHLYITF